MKRLCCFVLGAVLLLACAGCGGGTGSGGSAGSGKQKQPQTAAEDLLDLTLLSSTVAYSEVYNMCVTPNEYMGKRVRMKGSFSVYTDETTGKHYFACLVGDATACCSQALEFELAEPHTYPDDYPTEGSTITVEGIFGTYQEGTQTYCQLANATMK